jgi:hypothetical protein
VSPVQFTYRGRTRVIRWPSSWYVVRFDGRLYRLKTRRGLRFAIRINGWPKLQSET